MSDAIPSRLGQINAAGDADALFLKVYAGEVLTAFKETNVMEDKHLVRTISHGKSAQFPATWKADAEYHTPGAELLGGTIKHGERVINIDDILVSHKFIADIDEAKNHYDVRSIYSFEQGAALARKYDKQLLQVGVLAAREAATIDDGSGGSQLVNQAFDVDGESLAAGLYDAAQAMDEKDIPPDNRFCFLKPQHYYMLAQTRKVLDRDIGGAGSYAKGVVFEVAGIQIVKTNNLPNTVVAAEQGTKNTYDGDFTNTVGLIMHRSAIGTVKLLDLGLRADYDPRRLGTLMVAKYAVGHGILRPEAAIELAKA